MTLIPPLTAPAPQRNTPLFQAARKLETAFIAEMLRASGMGRDGRTQSGGIGAEQFSSFLIDAQAERISAAGGIGLAESLFRAMAKSAGGQEHG